jgi:hypothetical protein
MIGGRCAAAVAAMSQCKIIASMASCSPLFCLPRPARAEARARSDYGWTALFLSVATGATAMPDDSPNVQAD